MKCDIQLKGTVSHFEQLNDEDGVEIFVDLRAAALEKLRAHSPASALHRSTAAATDGATA